MNMAMIGSIHRISDILHLNIIDQSSSREIGDEGTGFGVKLEKTYGLGDEHDVCEDGGSHRRSIPSSSLSSLESPSS
ncbi:hypothetical protein L2E82_11619 [Cichorium intybus]|uniref:Uncharacterized protein n=1 Tax=Cichorium intybus TaxID=13427 RepID=A0ACB9GF15_CICIN|nr:hypothetical protein L2E82_11619 [Cichorium intybus]